MSDINKLIASLHIGADELRSEVDAVNREQKRIGEGTNLDLTKQVKEQIKLLQAAAGSFTGSSGKKGGGKSEALKKEIKLVNELSRDLIRAEQQMASLRAEQFKAGKGTQQEGTIAKQIAEKEALINKTKEEIAKTSEAARTQSKYEEALKRTARIRKDAQDKLDKAGAKQADDGRTKAMEKEIALVNNLSKKLLATEREKARLKSEIADSASGSAQERELQRQLALRKKESEEIRSQIKGVSQAAKAQSEYTDAVEKMKAIGDKARLGMAEREDAGNKQALQEEIALANKLSADLVNAEKAMAQLQAKSHGKAEGSNELAVLQQELALRRQEAEAIRQRIGGISEAALQESNYKEALTQVEEVQRKLNAELAKQDDATAAKSQAKQVADANKQIQDLKKTYKEIADISEKLNREERMGAGEGEYAQALREQLALKQGEYAAGKQAQEQLDQKILDQTKYNDLLREESRVNSGSRLKQMKQETEEQRKLIKNQEDYNRKIEDTTKRVMQWAASMVIMRGLSTLWKNATEYVSTYYDKMNEIRIVTMMTQEEADKLGENYRRMAEEMSVSSGEIATAAVEFWRQGLEESEVNARLKNTTMYAKISGQGFEEAAEIVTAATNSIEKDSGRVVDVLSYLGDASASGADEVGKAMQKSAASAEQFGLSFEWLGAYIATISEETRQAPEVIGTALNSIMARMHQIKQKGFNEEDETKINDVAKALATIDITLTDQQGNWMSMSEIMNGIAEKWTDMDARQQSYIATTMAGTRQQNYFLALMNDLSKGVENGSRAWELYTGALESAGVAAGKFAIWEESVTGAQNRMKSAQEDMYSLLNAEWMKKAYGGIAELVKWFTKGTEAMKGMNLVIPLVIAGIVGIGVAVKNLGGIMSAIATNPKIAAFLALVSLVVALTELGKSMELNVPQKDYADYIKDIETSNKSIERYASLQNKLSGRFTELARKTSLTAEEQAEYNSLQEEFGEVSDNARAAAFGLKDGYEVESEAVKTLSSELETLIALEKAYRAEQADKALREWKPDETLTESAIILPSKNGNNNTRWHPKMEEEVRELIDVAMSVVDTEFLKSVDRGYFYDKLFDLVAGTDGIVDSYDYSMAAETINKWIHIMYSQLVSRSNPEWNKDIITLMLEQVFGTGEEIDAFFDERAKEIEDLANNSLDMMRITRNYDNLISQGFSKDSMKKLAISLPQQDLWSWPVQNLVEDQLEGYLGSDQDKMFNWPVIEDGIPKLQTLNEEAKILMYNMVNAGTSIEQFNSLKLTSRSLEEFINNLRAGQTEAQAFAASLSFLADQARTQLEGSFGESTGYKEAITLMQSTFEEQVLTPWGKINNINGLMEQWNALDGEMQESIATTYPNLVIALEKASKAFGDLQSGTTTVKKCSGAFDELNDEMLAIKKSFSGRYFKGTERAIADLKKGTTNASDAFADYNNEARAAIEASSEYKTALSKLADGMKQTEDDVSNLADYLGYITPGELLKDWDDVGPMIESALAEGEDAFRRLNEAAFINITGGSSADFSDITNGLLLVQGMAQDTIDALIATGQWELETIKLPMEAYDWTGNVLRKVKATGGQTVLKYKGASALGSGKSGYQSSGSTKKSGGGGGGGGSSKGDTEVEIMLDKMEQVQTIQDHTRSLYSGQASLYEGRGELQGVIKYIEKEKGAIENQNKTLEENIANIEAHMLKKQQEVAAMSKSAKGYEDAADDLDKLQKAHQDYTLQLIENQAELEELNKAIKEHQDVIREMQINLRETILQAIEDREALNDRMLQGTIEVENEILDIIRERYEEERDMILEASEEKIDALEKEKNLLQEQLDLRKQQAEEEDKAARLKQLEAQLSRISADPTRKKEELELRKEIAELREEIAWDIADKEVEAQQKAIDEQITSVEDYMEYIENYYEDLFAHPTKLINEMKEILRKSDEEIIQWLKEHNEEYAASTENTQRDMVNSWNDMLMDMHGQIKTYWDEVEQIIAGGDDTIIAFLKENSADYKAAGKLQAEAYVDEWRKQLDDLKKALKEVNAEISVPNYSIIDKGTGSSSGGSSGSSGSSTSGSNEGMHTYKFKNKQGTWSAGYTDKSMSVAFNMAKKAAISHYSDAGMTNVVKEIYNAALFSNGSYIKKFAKGGMADYTGPAWLDGTKSNPERILSPYQTKLFDEMIKVLQRIDTISVPGIPAYGEAGKANSAYNVGDIIVNVDRLESDADYEEMAEKIFDTIMNRLNRTAPVGGIRMNR